MGIINHGVDAVRFAPALEEREQWRRVNGIPSDAVVIISTGRLVREKRIEWILRAFGSAAALNPKCWLILAGEGPMREDVERWIGLHPAANRIRLLGYIEDVAPLVRASDIYVLASHNEGFGIALCEAMATELVCIATRTPGPDRIIENGKDGFLVDISADAVEKALTQAVSLGAEQRRQLGARARQKVLDHYTVEHAVQNAFELLGLTPDHHKLSTPAAEAGVLQS
jgi:glycosyltransferase involved in cell wall biosynthesis